MLVLLKQKFLMMEGVRLSRSSFLVNHIVLLPCLTLQVVDRISIVDVFAVVYASQSKDSPPNFLIVLRGWAQGDGAWENNSLDFHLEIV